MAKYKINPLVILLLNILFPFALMFSSSIEALMICFGMAAFFLIYFGRYKRLLKFTLWLGIFYIVYLFLLNCSGNNTAMMAAMFVYVFMKCFPLMMLASILFYDYNTSEILSALQSLNLNREVMLGITVALRYFPTFKKEFKIMKECMKMRGISPTIRHPLKTLEYFLVPQLFRCSLLSDELTAAGLTKGIDNKGKRTSVFNVRFKRGDVLLSFLSLICIIFVIVWGDSIGSVF